MHSMVLNRSAGPQAPFASLLDPVSIADTFITVSGSTVVASLNVAAFQGLPPSNSPTPEQTGLRLAMQHSSMAAFGSPSLCLLKLVPFFSAIAPVMPSPTIPTV